MARDVKCILINVNSLISIAKRVIFDNFIKVNKPDIIFVTETKLNPRLKVNFENFNMIRKDRIGDGAGGGTCILIKDSYRYEELNLPSFTSIEVSGIKLCLENQQSINCFAVYHSAKINPSIDPRDFTKLANFSGTTPFLIGGDFNSKHTFWNNPSNCSNGTKLYDWFLNNSFNLDIDIIAPQEKTRNNAVLDFFIASTSLLNILTPPAVIDGVSDHEAVVLSIRNLLTVRTCPRQILDFKNTDWGEFNLTLDQKLQELLIPIDRNLSFDEINTFAVKLQTILIETSELHVPLYTLKKSYQVKLDNLTLQLIRERKTFRRRLFRARFTSREPLYKSIVRNLDVIIKNRIRISYTQQFEDKVKSIRHDKDMYKNVKSICGSTYSNAPLVHNNILVNDSRTKANIIGEVFDGNHKLTLNLGDPVFTNNVNLDIQNDFNNFNEPIVNFNVNNTAHFTGANDHKFITSNTLKDMTKVRNPKKTPGIDNISNYSLQRLSSLFFVKLALLFNHAYNVGYFPKVWRHAIVCPIPKPGKPDHLPTSYRPISLLTSISKLYERFIAGMLDGFVYENDILPNFQFGFRTAHSTLMALNIFQNDILINAHKQEPTVAVSLDIEKAFDTTWIEGLVYKLRSFGFPRTLCSIVYQFVSSRSFQVRVQDKLSEVFQVSAGVPQGSVLGPKLFNIYTSDIPPSPPKVSKLCFADDFITYTPSKSPILASRRLNTYLSTLSEYYNRWKIKINPEKVVAISFTGDKPDRPRRYNTADINLRIGNTPIPLQNSMKYLGVYFTPKMNFIEHVRKTVQKVYVRTKYLHNALRHSNRLDVNIKILCYKQLVRPIISYAFPIWSCISSAQMEILRALERQILRRCINYTRKPDGNHHSNSYLYEKAKTPRLDKFLMSIAHRYLDNLKDFNNPLVQDSCNLEDDYINRLRLKPAQYLDQFRDETQIAIPLYNRGFRDPQHRVYS